MAISQIDYTSIANTASLIANNTITATQLANNTITATQVANNTITPLQLSSTAQYTGFKNRIINGAMVIDQRNAGASITPTNLQYLVDRFYAGLTQASKYNVQQNAGSVTPPVGFINYLGITSSSAYSVLAADIFNITQVIEGFNIADFGWGTANAKTVTLSFQVYSSLTGTFGGAFTNGSYSYPFTYSIPVASTWTTISVTVVGPTAGTWNKNNTAGVYISFGLGVGSTYSGTAGAWASGNYQSATGAVSVVGTSGATFYITGVQLEVGSTATSFDVRDYGRELILCQRYYQTNNAGLAGYQGAGGVGLYQMNLTPNMRATPTIVSSFTYNVNSSGGAAAAVSNSSLYIYALATAAGSFQWTNSFTASAEL
jgi:hypothetical protein